MINEMETSEIKKSIGVVKSYAVTVNKKFIGQIDEMKDGRMIATACRDFETIKQAERWLTLI